jgi:RNA-directed DNA polymerase
MAGFARWGGNMSGPITSSGGANTHKSRKERAQSPEFLVSGHTLGSGNDVAAFLQVSYKQLSSALHSAPEDARYRSFEIPKRSGGVRRIDAPIGMLKRLQEALADKLSESYAVHPSAHGFIGSRSIVSNAAFHAGQSWVLNIDLADFFPSINFGRVRGLFMSPPFNAAAPAATLLAQLCTHRNGLPQGAATSPVISNLVSATLDRRLTRFAKEHRLRYSRYADDITLSSNEARFPAEAAHMSEDVSEGKEVKVGPGLESAISASGFSINYAKVRLQHRSQRQSVTGLKVNVRLNVRRDRIRKLRAMIHAWRKFGLEAAGVEYLQKYGSRTNNGHQRKPANVYRDVVYGHLAFIRMVRGISDPVYLKLCSSLMETDPTPPKFLREMAQRDTRYDVFISHASEDKAAIAQPIFEACERMGLLPFLDREHIAWGDNFTDKINSALGQAKVVLAIISKNSVSKKWPLKEVNAALNLEVSGEVVVLPLIVGSPDLRRLPLIRAKDSLTWDGNAVVVAESLSQALELMREAGQETARDSEVASVVSIGSRQEAGFWSRLLKLRLPMMESPFALTGKGARQMGTHVIEVPGVPSWPNPTMTIIPGGRFRMGSPRIEGARSGPGSREQPEHDVQFDYSFAIGRTVVTMAEWEAALEDDDVANPLESLTDSGWGRGMQPVINVTWGQAQAYIQWLNRKLSLHGRPDAYRLPTEAEWEYSCRAGSRSAYSFGERIDATRANFDGSAVRTSESSDDYRRRPIAVASFSPNAFGLYDMHGNVWEWCADVFLPNYIGAPLDGSARVHPPVALRVLRGGSWSNKPAQLRSSNRFGFDPDKSAINIGFRLARTIIR